MRRLAFVLALLVLLCTGALAQNYGYAHDYWGGYTAQNCTWPPSFKLAISAISRTTNTTTITVASTSSLVSLQSGYITGVADAAFNVNSAAPVVLTVVDGTHVTYPNTGTNGSSSGGFLIPANWYVQLVGNTWYNCDPLGNRLFLQSFTVMSVPLSGTVFTNKYGGNTSTSSTAIINEITSWNFNGIGDQPSTSFFTPRGSSCNGNCPSLPQFDNVVSDVYATSNLNGNAARPTKDLLYGLSTHFTGNAFISPVPFGCMDAFDGQFSIFQVGYLTNDASNQSIRTNSWEIGWSIGSSDQSACMSAGPDFDSYPAGHQGNDAGWMMMQTAPLQTFIPATDYQGLALPYVDPVVYTKAPQSSPPSSCTVNTPCSLSTYMSKKYGTIGALNTAWGSSYTTFNSSGTCLGYAYSWCGSTGAAIAVGTGDGTTLSFTVATHANVSPFSVQILLAGSAIGGDCPQFRTFNSVACGGSAGQGTIKGTNLSGGTITYSSGSLTVTFTGGHAPTAGQAITANLIWGGWNAGGTGLVDEDGAGSWLGTNPICVLSVADVNTPGTNSYSCRPGNPGAQPTTVNANQTWAADISDWGAQYFAQYYSSMRSGEKAAAPNLLYISPETTGNWSVPPIKGALIGAQPYVDVLFPAQYWGDQPSTAVQAKVLSYLTRYFTGPMMNLSFLTACQDSAVANKGGGVTCWGDAPQATQAARGNQYYTMLNGMLTSPSFSNTVQWIGNTWWSLYDCETDAGNPNNWGLKSCGGTTSGGINSALADNAYDGREPAVGSLACSSPLGAFTCGSEPDPGAGPTRPFGNAITETHGVQEANILWITATLPTAIRVAHHKLGGGRKLQ